VKNYRILIVDDEPDNIRVIRNCFSEAGEPYAIYQALSGEVALTITGAELPDLIITDWEMPAMDGIELIKQLKQNEATADIPVIMCTGVMTTSENLQTALNAGAVDFVRKPIDKIELLARVQSMLQLADSKKEIKQKYFIIEKKNSFITSLMESIPYPLVYYKPDGTIKGTNRQFDELFETSASEIIGSNLYNFKAFANSRDHAINDKKLLENSSFTAYEMGLKENVYLISKSLYHNTLNKPDGIFCITVDISELKNAYHEILEGKKRELASNAIRLMNLSEMNNKIIEKLEVIYNLPVERKNESIRNVINNLNIKASENIWREFELHFGNVFEHFYQTLKNHFPDLTPGDLKLCAFLRLNLSSKEIATLTFQNPKSIDMARYRLRKKINLTQDENLTDFLMRIN
jgi:CheY-like chemotaxis protein